MVHARLANHRETHQTQNLLDIGRVHPHKRGMGNKAVPYRSGGIHRHIPILVRICNDFGRLHDRRGSFLKCRQKTLLVEREKSLETAEHDLTFYYRNHSLPASTGQCIYGSACWLNVDVDQLLETFDVGPLSPGIE